MVCIVELRFWGILKSCLRNEKEVRKSSILFVYKILKIVINMLRYPRTHKNIYNTYIEDGTKW